MTALTFNEPQEAEDTWIAGKMPELVSILAVLGIFFPSSLRSVINNSLWLGFGVLIFSFFILFLFRRNAYLSAGALINIAVINGLIWLFTLFSPFKEYALGNSIIFLNISLLLALNLKNVPASKIIHRVFLAINLVNIPFAVLLVMSVPLATEIVLQNYAAFYPELVPFMLELKKPVLTFASHSIAGFYFFIFFWLNFKTYQCRQQLIYLLFALAYLVLSLFLLSNTAFGYFVFGFVQLSFYFIHKKPGAFLAASACIITGVFYFLFINASTSIPFWNAVNGVFAFQGGGFGARYSSSGDLANNLIYIKTNLISPIGMGYSPHLFYGDSGPLIYFLRGSIFLPAAIYIGFWFFLRGNCKSFWTSFQIFLFFMIFEIGISNLEYYRTLAFLPFIIVYLNGLESTAKNRMEDERP